MRVLSLFSGIGGLDVGFVEEGFNVVLAADASRAATATYNRNLEPVAQTLDLASVSPGDLPDAEVIVGGPPCQSFSLVGRRRPDDERGALVFRFLDVVEAVRPSCFVMENVPGIESSRISGRRLVDVLVERFERAGYTVAIKKLLATDYLVPQRRRRLFIMGRRNGEPVFPDPADFARSRLGVDRTAVDISAKAAIGDLGITTTKGMRASYRTPPESVLARWLRDGAIVDVSLHETPRMSRTDSRLVGVIPPGGDYADVPDELATPRILRFKETGGRTTTYGRLHPGQPAYTINTYFRRPNVGCHFHYAEPRLITPREAMRFQTLPDAWELDSTSQDQRNALIGNAVPALLGRAIAWSVRAAEARRSSAGVGPARTTRPRSGRARQGLDTPDAWPNPP